MKSLAYVRGAHCGWSSALSVIGGIAVVLGLCLVYPQGVLAEDSTRAFSFITGGRISQDTSKRMVAEFGSPHGQFRVDVDTAGIITISDIQTRRFVGARVPTVSVLKFSDGWTYDIVGRRWQEPPSEPGKPATIAGQATASVSQATSMPR